MTTQEKLLSKNPITNTAWQYRDGVFITKSGALRGVGPFDPWGNHLVLMEARAEKDGTGEVLAWHSTVKVGGASAEVVLVNDPS